MSKPPAIECEQHHTILCVSDLDWDFRDYTIRDLNGYHLTFGTRLE